MLASIIGLVVKQLTVAVVKNRARHLVVKNCIYFSHTPLAKFCDTFSGLISQLPKTRVAAESESESDPSLTAGSPKLGTAVPAARSKRRSGTFAAAKPAHEKREFCWPWLE